MAHKKEVNLLLLGIVAILAIVGLVLLFTSPAATGQAWQPPPLPPQVQAPGNAANAPVAVPLRGQVPKRGLQAIMVPTLEAASLTACPSGRLRTRMQGNMPYEALPGQLCSWFYCAGAGETTDPSAQPVLACVTV